MQDNNNKDNKFVKEVVDQKYEYGFTTNVQTEIIPKGLNEDVVRLISRRRARLAPRLPSESLPLLEDSPRSHMGTRPRSAH